MKIPQVSASCWIGAIVLGLLAACDTGKPPASTQKIPDYPNAIAVTANLDTSGADPKRTMGFKTSDKADEVFMYYENILTGDGWQLNPELSTSSKRRFGWFSNRNISAFDLFITASQDSGRTHIDIALIERIPK